MHRANNKVKSVPGQKSSYLCVKASLIIYLYPFEQDDSPGKLLLAGIYIAGVGLVVEITITWILRVKINVLGRAEVRETEWQRSFA
ncbi:MAG: hypothetical protein B6I34_06615 [Anaerolineaceae bacterium 4572_32.1]|nr:MAG: hypothetical protein B6I34_06615 [Anaerolineaceae bacterium 4572_32.1]